MSVYFKAKRGVLIDTAFRMQIFTLSGRSLLTWMLSIALCYHSIASDQPADITFSGPANSPISAAVAVPAGRAWFLTSGTVPPLVDDKAPAGSTARYGDTKTQGMGALQQIQSRLKDAGLPLKDVIYLRVYLAGDKSKEGKFDYQGWFDAYAQFFRTPENPVKPARSTVGVASLVNPDWLIEIEAVAIYPASKAGDTSGPATSPSNTQP